MVRAHHREPALLALADGTLFRGEAAGATGSCIGEVVFNTALSGYQEILTDPSYAGQIVVMTAPHIGNYGVNAADAESRGIFAEGFAVRDVSCTASNWRAERELEDELVESGCVAITGIDTRRLTRHLRDHGSMMAAIVHGDCEPAEAVAMAGGAPSLEGQDLASRVSAKEPYVVEPRGGNGARFEIAAYDFGIKTRILDYLAGMDARVTVWPAATPAAEVLAPGPSGVFLSNGPGDPGAVACGIEAARSLLGKVPVFGICLGHQILGLALGGSTFKLPFGHHGGNHPVKRLASSRVEITSQNHGFAVDGASLAGEKVAGLPWGSDREIPPHLESPAFGEMELTHINLNDGTLEGIRCLDVPAFSVQYHPEAAPGPNDATYLFGEFADLMEAGG